MRGAYVGVLFMVLGACATVDDGADDEFSEDESAVTGAFADSEASAQTARMNPHRHNHVGRGPLDRRACLNDIARRRARKMADGRCPGGDAICHFAGLGDAINAACPFGWEAAGENVGVGPSELGLWQAFLASPPHHDNIDGRYNKVGVGAYRRESDGLLFIAHVFVRSP